MQRNWNIGGRFHGMRDINGLRSLQLLLHNIRNYFCNRREIRRVISKTHFKASWICYNRGISKAVRERDGNINIPIMGQVDLVEPK